MQIEYFSEVEPSSPDGEGPIIQDGIFVTGRSRQFAASRIERIVTADGFTDVDRVCIIGMPVNSVNLYVNGEVELCRCKSRNPPGEDRSCIIVDHPIKMYVNDLEAEALAASIINMTGHTFLPVDPQRGRFLATPLARRLHIDDLIAALHAAGIAAVDLEQYGMKSTVARYRWLSDAGIADCTKQVDFGVYGWLCDSPADCILTVGTCTRADEGPIHGHWKTRTMFTDLLQHFHAPSCGTVEWSGRLNLSPGLDCYRIKLYPVYVHYLKAHYPDCFWSIPTNMKRMRQQLSILSRLAANLRSVDDGVRTMFERIRVEVSVQATRALHVDDVVSKRDEIFALIADCVYFVPVSLPIAETNLSFFCNRALLTGLPRGRDVIRVTNRKRRHIVTIMNEAGVATDAVLHTLSIRNYNGRFGWEEHSNVRVAPHWVIFVLL